VELFGGLGNQLFCYAAGTYLADKLSVNLRMFKRPSARRESDHGSSITSFNLSVEVEDKLSISEAWMLKLRKIVNLILEKLKFPSQFSTRLSRIHRAKNLGKDPDIDLVRPGHYVVGYFQTHEYFSDLISRGNFQTIQMRKPSRWFLEQSQSAEREKPIMVHVRRGDYNNPENATIGGLSPEYYRNGLDVICKELSVDLDSTPVWVFSDEIELARTQLSSVMPVNTRWVEPPAASSDPAESLLLMSKGLGLLIANSTLSWWAAAISSDAVVAAPTKWFSGMPDPEGLIPQSWLRVESSWL
jgi:hypothetical protein